MKWGDLPNKQNPKFSVMLPNYRALDEKAGVILDEVIGQMKKKRGGRKIAPPLHDPDELETRPVRKRIRYTKEQKEEMKQKELEEERKAKAEQKRKRIAKYPYWVWTEVNGWENETWKFYFTDVTPEMEKVLQSLITKAHRSNDGHEKTAITHRPRTADPVAALLGIKPVIVCCGCTKFLFRKCKFSKSKVQELMDEDEGGYMSGHSLGGTLDLDQLKRWDQMSDEDIFQQLYKGGIVG
jgi:hypothetical protein